MIHREKSNNPLTVIDNGLKGLFSLCMIYHDSSWFASWIYLLRSEFTQGKEIKSFARTVLV